MSNRRRLSEAQKEANLERQGYVCVGCGKPLTGARNVEWDHRRSGLPRWFFDYEGSGVDPDDPDHQYAMHATCHDELYRADRAAIHKTKRRAGWEGQRARRLTGGPRRKITSRGFEK